MFVNCLRLVVQLWARMALTGEQVEHRERRGRWPGHQQRSKCRGASPGAQEEPGNQERLWEVKDSFRQERRCSQRAGGPESQERGGWRSDLCSVLWLPRQPEWGAFHWAFRDPGHPGTRPSWAPSLPSVASTSRKNSGSTGLRASRGQCAKDCLESPLGSGREAGASPSSSLPLFPRVLTAGRGPPSRPLIHPNPLSPKQPHCSIDALASVIPSGGPESSGPPDLPPADRVVRGFPRPAAHFLWLSEPQTPPCCSTLCRTLCLSASPSVSSTGRGFLRGRNSKALLISVYPGPTPGPDVEWTDA